MFLLILAPILLLILFSLLPTELVSFLAWALLIASVISLFIFLINRKKEDEPSKKVRKNSGIFLAACAALCVLCFLGSAISGSSSGTTTTSSSKTVTCGYCKKSYSITSSNGKNISRTRLCNSCYAIYNSATTVLGK